MSSKSNDQGRAYEYICLLTLNEEINKIRKAEIEYNSAYQAAEHAWNLVDEAFQSILKQSAKAAVETIFDMEPMIIEESNDILKLKIQIDAKGEEGDVRDIVISRSDVKWEIGLSIKHNHFAVKHSRLGGRLDFGDRWFGIPCSQEYWNDIKPIFEYLTEQKTQNKKIPQKKCYLILIKICRNIFYQIIFHVIYIIFLLKKFFLTNFTKNYQYFLRK